MYPLSFDSDAFTATFLIGVTVFAITQIIRGVATGRIFSISSWMPTRDRRRHPFGFWSSLAYYVIWAAAAVYFGVAYLLAAN